MLLRQNLCLGFILGIWTDLSLFLHATIAVWLIILDLNVPCWNENKYMLLDPSLESLMDLNTLFVTIVMLLVI